MPLTAAEVRATRFGTTRVRAGYDMEEVDAFLDVIEADVAQYTDELQRLRDGEAVLRTQSDQLQTRLMLAERRLLEAESELAGARSSMVAATAPVVPADLAEALESHPEAADVLALAQQTADEIVRYAHARADAVRASIRATLDEQRAILDRETQPRS